VNTASDERFPQVSPDGRWLFIVSNRALQGRTFPKALTREEMIGRLFRPKNGWEDVCRVSAEVILSLMAQSGGGP